MAFNVRRESIVLLGVIGVMALYDVASDGVRRQSGGESFFNGVTQTVRTHWRAIVTPFASFAASAALAQLLLPTDLLPDNGNSSAFLDDRMREYPEILSYQLGLGENTAIGVAVLLVAVVGAVIGVRRRPTLDGPLLLLAVFSTLAVSTHLRRVDRYWFQVTPWVVYFATVALLAGAGWLLARRFVPARIARLATVRHSSRWARSWSPTWWCCAATSPRRRSTTTPGGSSRVRRTPWWRRSSTPSRRSPHPTRSSRTTGLGP